MTTQRDLDIAAATGTPTTPPLTICAECGWYVLMNHAEKCDPAQGHMAMRWSCRL